MMEEKPWIMGPLEVLIHGIEHYYFDTEKDLRFALIHCDNASELGMKSYIRFQNPVLYDKIRKDWNTVSKSYHKIMSVVDDEMSLSEDIVKTLDYTHTLRNDQYHQGSLSPRKADVFNSIINMNKLFKLLFSKDLDEILEINLYENVLMLFVETEYKMNQLCLKNRIRYKNTVASKKVELLIKKKAITDSLGDSINELYDTKHLLISDMNREIHDDYLYEVYLSCEEIFNEISKLL